jgi:hypothetical protein
VQSRARELFEEEGVIHPIKSFADVDGGYRCPSRGLRVVKAIGNPGGDGKKSRGTRTEENKAMLKTSRSKRSGKERKDKSLKNFYCRGEKRDVAVGDSKVRGFSRFEDGDDVRCLPDSGEVSLTNGVVKKGGEIGDTPGI